MERLCISRELLGTERHLLCSDGYEWVDAAPGDAWFFSGQLKPAHSLCFDTLLALFNRTVDFLPPKRFVDAIDSLLPKGTLHSDVPWVDVLPSREHRAFVKKLVNEATVALTELPKDYYRAVWGHGSEVLRSLQPAKVDLAAYNELVNARVGNVKVVESFDPDGDGMCKVTTYNRLATCTGRLTVESGPQILTLKREYKSKLLRSVYPDGSVLSLDFAALEARVLLYEAGGRCDEIDLYGMIVRDVFHDAVSRNAVKGAVISELYGSSREVLGRVLGIEGKELEAFVSKIKRLFKTNALLKRVKSEFVKNGWITNRYGRRVLVDEPMNHIFVNYYAQATGADVALLGFSEILSRLKLLDGVRPIFLLHDALIIDCPKEHVEAVKSETSVKISGYVQKFHIKVETISCTSV